MSVAVDGREIGVAEVLGHQARVAGRLAKPGRRGVAKRVGGDALLDARPACGARDDPGEDRRLQAPAAQAAEDRRVRFRLLSRAESGELVRECDDYNGKPVYCSGDPRSQGVGERKGTARPATCI